MCTLFDNTSLFQVIRMAYLWETVLKGCGETMASVLWSLHLTVALMEFWFLQTHSLGLGPFYIACRHLTCWGGCTLSTYAFQTAVESEISQAGVPMSYSQKTDCLILGASHCLPQYGFTMYGHLEDIKFQVFSSSSPSPRLVAMAF